MGQSWSKKEEVVGFLSQEELEEVKIGSCLTREEIQTLYNRFAKVDLDASDTLDVDEFLQFPEFRLNPLAYRLKELLDPKDTGVITFRAFVGVMSAFSAAALPEEKHRLAFQLYDMDNDGRISKDDLFGALKMTVAVASDGGGGTPTPNATAPAAADDQHATLDEDGLREVVENTFDEMAPGLTHIDFDAFVKVVTLPGCELLSKMTMQF